MRLTVSIAEPALAVDPGEFVRTEVVIRNDSGVKERALVHVAGVVSPWSWIVPAAVEVGPGSEAVVALGFRVPRTTEPAAGPLEFEVVVAEVADGHRASADVATEVRATGVLTVSAFVDIAIHVDPGEPNPALPSGHRLVVENLGNVPATVNLHASSGDPRLEVSLASGVVETAPGESIRVAIGLRARRRPLLGGRALTYSVSAAPDGGEPRAVAASVTQPAWLTRRAAVIAGAAGLLVLVCGLRLTLLSPEREPSMAAVAGATATDTPTASMAGPGGVGDCPGANHVDPAPIGTVRDIASLPAQFSFFHVAEDGCSPARWNPCEPIHYVINPANAPPTGVADTREAFRRLGKATGMTYVDDGITDETTGGAGRAYQPDRYGERWAPILVHWMGDAPGPATSRRAGGGAPIRVGEVYVSGELLLSPAVVTDEVTRTTIGGGFVDKVTIGRIGSDGVTWGRVILHELGHITGLGHVSDPSQLMYPDASDQTGTSAFQRWDLAGLQFLGKEAACLETPPPAPQVGLRGGSAGTSRTVP